MAEPATTQSEVAPDTICFVVKKATTPYGEATVLTESSEASAQTAYSEMKAQMC